MEPLLVVLLLSLVIARAPSTARCSGLQPDLRPIVESSTA